MLLAGERGVSPRRFSHAVEDCFLSHSVAATFLAQFRRHVATSSEQTALVFLDVEQSHRAGGGVEHHRRVSPVAFIRKDLFGLSPFIGMVVHWLLVATGIQTEERHEQCDGNERLAVLRSWCDGEREH